VADFKYNKVLIFLIALGLMAAGIVAWQRHQVEVQNNQVELVMDYEEVVKLAQTEGVPVSELMDRLKEAGITTLAVHETSLEKLHNSGKLTVVSGADLIGRYRSGLAGASLPVPVSELAPDKVYVFGNGLAFEETYSDLVRRLGAGRVKVYEGPENNVMAVAANYEQVLEWNLGLSTEEMKTVAAYGFYVMARPTNYTLVKPDDIDAVFTRLAQIDKVSGIIFAGKEVLGYPDLLPQTAARMKELGLTLGLIEHPLQLQFVKQEGLLQLAALNDYKAARVYTISKDEQAKLKPEAAIHRWALTDKERNVRINLLRPYEEPETGKTLLETNLEYVAGVKEAVEARGFNLGPAGVFQPYMPSRWLLAVMVLGATAAGVLLLTLIWPFAPRYQYIMTAVIATVLIWPVLSGGGTVIRQAAALVSACVLPVLVMTWLLDRWRQRPAVRAGLGRILAEGLATLALAVFLSLSGGFYVGALLGDVRFMLDIEIYRGVKLTFVAPVILITMIYLTRFSFFAHDPQRPRDVLEEVGRILNYPVYFKSVLALGLAAIAAWIYVGRSGHTAGVPVPAIEIKLRYLLENLMYARPRVKEFLIGHPAMILLIMGIYRHWPRFVHYGLVVAATIGQGSLVETFAHIRTPFFMSVMRAADGLLLGALVGIFAVVGVQVLQHLTAVLGRRATVNE